MFEYLMPMLVMPSYENTLLDHACRSAVAQQIEYGRARAVPWGISESGYFQTALRPNHQYRTFVVPGLGLTSGRPAPPVRLPPGAADCPGAGGVSGSAPAVNPFSGTGAAAPPAAAIAALVKSARGADGVRPANLQLAGSRIRAGRGLVRRITRLSSRADGSRRSWEPRREFARISPERFGLPLRVHSLERLVLGCQACNLRFWGVRRATWQLPFCGLGVLVLGCQACNLATSVLEGPEGVSPELLVSVRPIAPILAFGSEPKQAERRDPS